MGTGKIKNYQNGAQKICTYMDVRNMFNTLNKDPNVGFYGFNAKTINTDGKETCGFNYTGYVTGVKLRNILDKIGIKYYTLLKHGSGVQEESEIHIDVKDKAKMLKIYEEIGTLQSNVLVEIDKHVENTNLLKQLSQEISR